MVLLLVKLKLIALERNTGKGATFFHLHFFTFSSPFTNLTSLLFFNGERSRDSSKLNYK